VKKHFALFVSLIMLMCILTSCGGSSADPDTAAEDAAQNNQVTEEQEDGGDQPEETEEPEASEPSVTLRFDTHAYPDPGNHDRYNVLTYATNSGDQTARATIRYKAYDHDGNVLDVFDNFNGKYNEEFEQDVYIPANVTDFPVAFSLPAGFKYDYSTGKDMPEIDHMEMELLEVQVEETEDIKEHFTPGEPEIKSNQIYIYVKFDQVVEDRYSTLFANYTLLGYSGGNVTAVCCRNDYPYGSSSFSVSYAKENSDSSFLVYHDVPRETVDTWELYLGCISGQA